MAFELIVLALLGGVVGYLVVDKLDRGVVVGEGFLIALFFIGVVSAIGFIGASATLYFIIPPDNLADFVWTWRVVVIFVSFAIVACVETF